MTMDNTAPQSVFTGNGVTTAFATGFKFFDAAEIEVIERVIATGVETVKTITTHYTVSGGEGATGTVTAVSAPASTVKWFIRRVTARAQTTDVAQGDNFSSAVWEEIVDRLQAQIRELDEKISRAVQFPKTDQQEAVLPADLDRASKALIFDADGGVTVSTDDYEDQVATTAAAQAAAEAAQAAAEAAQAAAEAAQTLAETAKTNAETAETNAETAETNAETAETNAEAAQAAAEAAQAAAEAAADKMTGTSTTSLLIEVASKIFTTQADKFFPAGTWVLITSDADPTDYMHGQVTTYSGTTLTVNVTNIGGSGTLADWTIRVSGTRGATGATGSQGVQGDPGADGLSVTWLGAYNAGTAYVVNDAVSYQGSAYINTSPSTGVVPTNVANWDLLAAKGDTGAGTGDVLSTNNLSDLDDIPTARTNLGLGAMALAASVATGDIDADAVTYAKIQNVSATDKVLGRSSGGAGDIEEIACTAAGRALLDDADAAAQIATLGARKQGLESIYIPASAMTSRTTNGPAAGSTETGTNKVMLITKDYDAATAEYAQFAIRMPKSWNEGTVTATFVWKHAAAATYAVVWGCQGVALSNDDAGDTAFGTAQTVTDTGGTTSDIYISDATAAITIAGSPAAGDWVVFQVYRDAAAGGDTLDVDAGLLGAMISFTTDAADDT